MTERERRMVALGKGPSGVSPTWGGITGDITDQTDLVEELNGKQDTLTAGENITIEDNVISATVVEPTWGGITGDITDQTDLVGELNNKQDTLTAGDNITIEDNVISATVGEPTWGGITGDITDQTDLVEELNGKQDTLTAGENITIEDNVISATGGGGSKWFGTEAEFEALEDYDADTEYFISDKIDYNTDIKHTPNLGSYARKSYVDASDSELATMIGGKFKNPQFMTQEEFDDITPLEGENYMIEGNTVQMVVTFDDDTTATYNVVID